MKLSHWKQLDLALCRGLIGILLLTEWQPAFPAFFGWWFIATAALAVMVLVMLLLGAAVEDGGHG